MRTAIILLTVTAQLAQQTSAVSTTIGVRSFPPALTIVYSELPDKWSLEATVDLTNWYSVIHSGDIAPKEFSFTLTNENQAQFYRMRY